MAMEVQEDFGRGTKEFHEATMPHGSGLGKVRKALPVLLKISHLNLICLQLYAIS